MRKNNVAEMPWVPVRYLDGRIRTVSLGEVLRDAHLIADLHSPDAATRIGLLMFLPTVFALALRHAGGKPEPLPGAAVEAVLSQISEHLWLEHPDTPFMQDARIDGKSASLPARWLNLFAPSDSGKGWECSSADPHYDPTLSPAEAALYLVTSWFLAAPMPGTSSGYYQGSTERWRGRGSAFGAGLRAFAVGSTLLDTLLMNTQPSWVSSGTPSWIDLDQIPGASALGDATWSGTHYLLRSEGDRYSRVLVAGRRIGQFSEDEVKNAERGLWAAHPAMLRRNQRGTSGEVTPEMLRIRPVAAGSAGLQHVQELFAQESTRDAVMQVASGLKPSGRYQVASVSIEGSKQAPVIGNVHWLNLPEHALSSQSRALLIAVANKIAVPYRKLLLKALTDGLGKPLGPRLVDSAQAQFAWRAEPHLMLLLQGSIEDAITPEQMRPFAEAVMAAFDDVTRPYRTPRTLAGVGGAKGLAVARARLEQKLVVKP